MLSKGFILYGGCKMGAIIYRSLDLSDLHNNVLVTFNRYQKTTTLLAENNNTLIEKEDYFIDDWDKKKKSIVINDLRKCMANGGLVIAAYFNQQLVGFANIEGKRFGRNLAYVEMPYIHISNEHRGKGIGKRLFALTCEGAKQLGAKKLYIGAHPSIETQKFYKTVGCTLAKEINKEVYNREPLDIQLEYKL
jgi:ribosomal protein S18 acetylase RimI-like enzyme